MSCIPIQIADLLVDEVTTDSNGVVYTATVFDGWFDGPPVRIATQEVQPIGEVITVARENARAITLELVATIPPMPVPARKMTDLEIGATTVVIRSVFNCLYVPTLLIVDDVEFGAGTLSSLVRRVAPIKRQPVGDHVGVRFQILLSAPDPLRYEGATGSGTGHL